MAGEPCDVCRIWNMKHPAGCQRSEPQNFQWFCIRWYLVDPTNWRETYVKCLPGYERDAFREHTHFQTLINLPHPMIPVILSITPYTTDVTEQDEPGYDYAAN